MVIGQLNVIQKQLLDMLAWFHEVCELNDFCCFALCGTMLGATRHKGFVPWDNDVGRTLADYVKIEKSAQKATSGKCIL